MYQILIAALESNIEQLDEAIEKTTDTSNLLRLKGAKAAYKHILETIYACAIEETKKEEVGVYH